MFNYKFVSLARRPIFKENRVVAATHLRARSWHESAENGFESFRKFLPVQHRSVIPSRFLLSREEEEEEEEKRDLLDTIDVIYSLSKLAHR